MEFGGIRIKQLNMAALHFAHKVLGVISGYSDLRPHLVYADLFHPRLPYKKLPEPVLCNVEVMYRLLWKHDARFMVTAYHRCNSNGTWLPVCDHEVCIYAENPKTKDVIKLIGRTDSEGDFKLEEESQKLWLVNFLEVVYK